MNNNKHILEMKLNEIDEIVDNHFNTIDKDELYNDLISIGLKKEELNNIEDWGIQMYIKQNIFSEEFLKIVNKFNIGDIVYFILDNVPNRGIIVNKDIQKRNIDLNSLGNNHIYEGNYVTTELRSGNYTFNKMVDDTINKIEKSTLLKGRYDISKILFKIIYLDECNEPKFITLPGNRLYENKDDLSNDIIDILKGMDE